MYIGKSCGVIHAPEKYAHYYQFCYHHHSHHHYYYQYYYWYYWYYYGRCTASEVTITPQIHIKQGKD